jgi:hypothetical protein
MRLSHLLVSPVTTTTDRDHGMTGETGRCEMFKIETWMFFSIQSYYLRRNLKQRFQNPAKPTQRSAARM